MPPAASPPLSIASLTTPVAMGYIPLGAVFGFLFVQAGGAAWLAVASSLLVYAGAAQFMMVPMLAAGLPVGTIALATLVLNLRHVFYGLSLLNNMPAGRWQRWYGIFALTDESYSVLTALPGPVRPRRMALVCALNQGWWVLGTVLGVILGARVRLGLTGLDFALAALFAVLAVEQWRARRDLVPVWTALASYALALAILPGQALAVAIAACLAAAAWRPVQTAAAAAHPETRHD
jgi:4-azaleucine resistance transporter AzlC